MAEPEVRRRRRPAVSCTLCRRRKIRCNREQPCSNCLRARKNVACVYEELPPVVPGTAPASAPGAVPTPPKQAETHRPLNTEGIVFRNPAQQQQQQQTPNSAVDGLLPRPQLSANAAVVGLTGLTVADPSPSGGGGGATAPTSSVSVSAAATGSAPHVSAPPTTAPTTVPTSTEPSPFDRNTFLGLPVYQAFASPSHEDVQSMQLRIRDLEAQLNEKRKQHSHSHRLSQRSSHHRSRPTKHNGTRHRDHEPLPENLDAEEPAPRLPHVVVPDVGDRGPMSRLTLADPPSASSRSHRLHRSPPRRRSPRPRCTSRPRRSQSPRSRSPAPRSSRPTRSRSPYGRPYSRSWSRSPSHSLASSRRPTSRSPSPASRPLTHPHSHSHHHLRGSHDDSAARTRGNPLSDRGRHHGCHTGSDDNNNNDNDNNRLSPPSVANQKQPIKASSIAADFFVSTRGPSCGPREYRMHMTSRSVMHKTRLFGQSHWVNSIVGFRDIFEMIDPLVTDSTASKVFVEMQRLKHIGRVIKALRVGPAWTPPLVGGGGGCNNNYYDLPPRPLADELVDCYLRSTESMYRILHVPMFRREYEALWQAIAAANVNTNGNANGGGSLSKSDMAFLVQLKLVLAIGTATHHDHIALRMRAIRWFYTAQAWFAEPEYKAHLTMQILQIHILLLFAREATGIGGALIWISTGDLVHSAVYMGLHRDPDRLPKRMSHLAAEMRRRLWNTILELAVATSLDAGAPVMLSLTDFDARAPSNIDDDVLEESVLAEAAAAAVAAGVAATGVDGEQADGRRGGHKEIYVDDGGAMQGPRPPKSVAELLEIEKGNHSEFLRGRVGEQVQDDGGDDDRCGDRGGDRRGWPGKVYADDGGAMCGIPAPTPAAEMRELATKRDLRSEQVRKILERGRIHDNSRNDDIDGAGNADDVDDSNSEGEEEHEAANGPPVGAASSVVVGSTKFTQMSIAIALRKLFPLRLAICKFLNDMGPPGSYAETLRFDRQFRAAYRALFETLQLYNVTTTTTTTTGSSPTSSTSPPPTPSINHFTFTSVHLIMRRYLMCLHVPYFGASMQDETAYAYSRRVVVDTAVRIWHASCPGIVDDSVSTVEAAETAADEAQGRRTDSTSPPPAGRTFVDPELARQTMLGAGAPRRLAMQASLLVAAEAKFQLVEEDIDATMSPPTTATAIMRAPIRPDLLAIIESASHWCLRSIEAGETNFKGYLLWRLIAKQLDGMRRGMMAASTATAASRMALARELVQAAEEAEAICVPILEGMLARGQQEAAAAAAAGAATGTTAATGGTEVHNLVRMCRTEDCPCHVPYRQQQQRQQREQREKREQQALEAAQQIAQQQQQQQEQLQQQQQEQVQLQGLSTQPFLPGVQPTTIDPMAMDFTVDNWAFIMPDAESLNIGSGEPLSWLFSGEASQGILW